MNVVNPSKVRSKFPLPASTTCDLIGFHHLESLTCIFQFALFLEQNSICIPIDASYPNCTHLINLIMLKPWTFNIQYYPAGLCVLKQIQLYVRCMAYEGLKYYKKQLWYS